MRSGTLIAECSKSMVQKYRKNYFSTDTVQQPSSSLGIGFGHEKQRIELHSKSNYLVILMSVSVFLWFIGMVASLARSRNVPEHSMEYDRTGQVLQLTWVYYISFLLSLFGVIVSCCTLVIITIVQYNTSTDILWRHNLTTRSTGRSENVLELSFENILSMNTYISWISNCIILLYPVASFNACCGVLMCENGPLSYGNGTYVMSVCDQFVIILLFVC